MIIIKDNPAEASVDGLTIRGMRKPDGELLYTICARTFQGDYFNGKSERERDRAVKTILRFTTFYLVETEGRCVGAVAISRNPLLKFASKNYAKKSYNIDFYRLDEGAAPSLQAVFAATFELLGADKKAAGNYCYEVNAERKAARNELKAVSFEKVSQEAIAESTMAKLDMLAKRFGQANPYTVNELFCRTLR